MVIVEKLVDKNWQGSPKNSEKICPNTTLSTRAAAVGSQ
jgi:hypothetical protein